MIGYNDRYYRAWLLSKMNLKSSQIDALTVQYGSLAQASALTSESWFKHGIITNEQHAAATVLPKNESYESYVEQLERLQVRVLLPDDCEYPHMLHEIQNPPELLYAQGELQLSDRACVAIVGSRRASQYGRRVAEELAANLSSCGICVVSGLARGIDGAAHKGALTSDRGRTCAIVGTGLDKVYPAEHTELAERIRQNGVIYSEYPLGSEPLAYHFPARNRLISGISLGVVVVEAGENSGTQITVNYALEQNREIFAIPGSIYAANSRGPHRLLKQGARLVEAVDDILEELQLLGERRSNSERKEAESATPDVSLSLMQQKILSLLEIEPLHLDLLQNASKLPVGTLLSELMQMELLNLIEALPGRIYALKRSALS